MSGEFKESEHPRDEEGKFTTGGGGNIYVNESKDEKGKRLWEVKNEKGEVVRTYPTSIAKKNVIDLYNSDVKKERDEKVAKKQKASENKIKNETIKQNMSILNKAMNENESIIKNAHKNSNLKFNSIDNDDFSAKDTIKIYESPSFNGRKGSEYRLILVNGEPAFARQSDHWGEFETRKSFENEDERDFQKHNWSIQGVDTKGNFGKKRYSGYIMLKDLPKDYDIKDDCYRLDCVDSKYEDFFLNKNESQEIDNELDIARKIISGELYSPQVFHNVTLIDLRITGTGAAYRVGLEEFVHRHPDNYLNDEFLERCYGLPVLWNHPENGIMSSEDFTNTIIGTIFKPYIKGDEVWGIAKIYDAEAAKKMVESQLSTSPGVLFTSEAENAVIELSDGKHILIEDEASLLDHVAICEQGVWDKMGEASGVRIDSQISEDYKMEDEKEVKNDKDNGNTNSEGEDYPRHKNDASGDPTALNAIMDAIGKISSRLDAVDARLDAAAKSKVEPKADDQEEDETESAAMADAQARADSVLQLHGKHAPRPMRGETAQAYRNRLLKPLQEFSEAFKDVDFTKIADIKAFKHFEDQVYHDAQVAASDPKRIVATLPRGQLREVSKRHGRVDTVEFVGDISGFTNAFRQPSFKGKIVKEKQ